MCVKDCSGDKFIVYGCWANMKKGIPGEYVIDVVQLTSSLFMMSSPFSFALGSRRQRGVPGNPGNLQIRLDEHTGNGTWTPSPKKNIASDFFDLSFVKVNLRKGEVSFAVSIHRYEVSS